MINMSTWRELQIGETVQSGDAMRIGLRTGRFGYSLIMPCKYDRQGKPCCVGATVDEPDRWFRQRTTDHATYGKFS